MEEELVSEEQQPREVHDDEVRKDLCEHSTWKQVKKEGPNKGRFFFSCDECKLWSWSDDPKSLKIAQERSLKRKSDDFEMEDVSQSMLASMKRQVTNMKKVLDNMDAILNGNKPKRVRNKNYTDK